MKIIDPNNFDPSTKGKTAVLEAFVALEPDNRQALTTTYLHALLRGLPVDLFYQFTREILQDPTIRNRGAVFNKKVQDYFKR